MAQAVNNKPEVQSRFIPVGSEFVGEVVDIGYGVTNFKVGDKVIGNNKYPDSGVEGVLGKGGGSTNGFIFGINNSDNIFVTRMNSVNSPSDFKPPMKPPSSSDVLAGCPGSGTPCAWRTRRLFAGKR